MTSRLAVTYALGRLTQRSIIFRDACVYNKLSAASALRSLCSGKFRMPMDSVGQHGSVNGNSIEGALALCTEALGICDALNLSSEIGARLQHVICSLEDELTSAKPTS